MGVSMNSVERTSLGIIIAVVCAAAALAAIRLVWGRGMTWLVGVETSSHRALAIVLLAVWALLGLLPWVLGWHPLLVLLGAVVGLLPMFGAIVQLRKVAQSEGRRRHS
jgi:hypothetical protein